MEKNLKISAKLAVELLGQNEALDVVLRATFTEKELSLDICDRIKTFEDALAYLGESVKDFNNRTKSFDAHKLALEKLEIITLALNEGKRIKYDGSTYLYYPYFYVSGGFSFDDVSCGYAYSNVTARLCFWERRLAEYAGKQFRELYEIWFNG